MCCHKLKAINFEKSDKEYAVPYIESVGRFRAMKRGCVRSPTDRFITKSSYIDSLRYENMKIGGEPEYLVGTFMFLQSPESGYARISAAVFMCAGKECFCTEEMSIGEISYKTLKEYEVQ